MIAAVLAAGVLGLLILAALGVAETRIVTVRPQTTAARKPTPLPARAAVDQPKHRRR